MESLSIGQVVLATFPFSDLSSRKIRPCLVIGLSEFNDIILCQITSQTYGGSRVIALGQTDFERGSIVTDSFIRPDKIATLDRGTIKRILGLLTGDKLGEVKLALKNLFEIK